MIKRTWFLLLAAVVARVVSIWLLKGEVYTDLISRSLVGRAVMAQPAWLDIAVPLMFIVLLRQNWSPGRFSGRAVGMGFADTIGLLMFPLVTSFALYVYVQHWSISMQINWPSILRFVQFVLAFLAINLLMDDLPLANRWGRRFVGLVAGLALAVTQDLTLNITPKDFQVVALFFGVGTTQALTALAFRPVYRESPWRATAAALFVGAIVCFLVIAVESQALFTLGLPVLALIIGAVTISSPKRRPRWVALAVLVVISLGLSLALPRLVSPEFAATLVENVQSPLTTVQVGSISVRYGDPVVRDVAIGMAKVLEGANAVSQDAFGVSPQVNELVIWGIAPGGFHAEFPHRIVGNLASEEHAKLSLDSAYLNSPTASIHFPDPVNAILHEYCHLYGVVPYMPWIMGPEEEGWATYAATRLSLQLYRKYGAGLWIRPYDYGARAEAITRSNLNGHPVIWSHPDEFGGFHLWYALGERDGEQALFLKRWQLTQRSFSRSLLMRSDPDAARRLADGMGQSDFVSLGSAAAVPFAQVISVSDWETSMAGIMGMKPEQARAIYDSRANLLVHPAVRVPAAYPWGLDAGATLAVLVIAVGMSFFKSRREFADARVSP